tara:strand:+ start:1369 stop:1635 length:267 start_codon:yes stop_codon:yes gene_type:complete
LLTVTHCHRNRACGTRNKLLASENPITFDKRSTRSIASYRENLADNLTDDTDQSSHDSFLTTAADHRRHVSKRPDTFRTRGVIQEATE